MTRPKIEPQSLKPLANTLLSANIQGKKILPKNWKVDTIFQYNFLRFILVLYAHNIGDLLYLARSTPRQVSEKKKKKKKKKERNFHWVPYYDLGLD